MNPRLRFLTATLAFLLAILAMVACSGPTRSAVTPLGYIGTNPVQSFSYLSGNDGGTVTVPTDEYVSQIFAAAGTFTVTPSNQYTLPACDAGESDSGILPDGGDAGGPTWIPCNDAGPTITAPTQGVYLDTVAAFQPGAHGLADGTVITFATGTTYVVTFVRYGP